MDEAISQAIIVTKSALSEDVGTQRLALFDEAGAPLVLGGGGAAMPSSFLMTYESNDPIWTVADLGVVTVIEWDSPADLSEGNDISISPDGLTVTIETEGTYVFQLDMSIKPVDNTGAGTLNTYLYNVTGVLASSFLIAGNSLGSSMSIDGRAYDSNHVGHVREQASNTSVPVACGSGDTFQVGAAPGGVVSNGNPYGPIGSGFRLVSALLTVRRIA